MNPTRTVSPKDIPARPKLQDDKTSYTSLAAACCSRDTNIETHDMLDIPKKEHRQEN